MASKKNKTKAFANTLKGKDLAEFKKRFFGKEPLFPESIKRAKEAIKRTHFMEGFLK